MTAAERIAEVSAFIRISEFHERKQNNRSLERGYPNRFTAGPAGILSLTFLPREYHERQGIQLQG